MPTIEVGGSSTHDGGWRQAGDGDRRVVCYTPTMRDHLSPTAHAAIPFLWICGPSGVGKSTVGWELFTLVRAAGVTAAYLDTDQIGFCRPEPRDDPDHYTLRSRNVAALWPNFLAAGARAVIVSGILETPDGVRLFTAAVPGAAVTIVRLRATPATLRERIFLRGRGGGPPIPGEQEWHGATAARLLAAWEDSVATTEALERKRIGDTCVDTDGRSVREVARAILAQAPGWASLLTPTTATSPHPTPQSPPPGRASRAASPAPGARSARIRRRR
jgi:hypothetical protein